MIRNPFPFAVAILALGGGCAEVDGDSATTRLDTELAATSLGADADPAVMATLSGPLMVDPMLSASANADSVRPPDQPFSGMVPSDDVAAGGAQRGEELEAAPAAEAAGEDCTACKASAGAATLEALAARLPGARTAPCIADMRPSARWSLTLPAAATLFPDARVVEASGAQMPRCSVRATSLFSATPMETLIDWQHVQSVRAGYTTRHWIDGDQHVLVATRARDGASATFWFNARDGGTAIDLVTIGG